MLTNEPYCKVLPFFFLLDFYILWMFWCWRV